MHVDLSAKGRGPTVRLATLFAILASAAFGVLVAQQQPPPQTPPPQTPPSDTRPGSPQQAPPRPTFRTEANYVRVDAYPTQNGSPVLDLTKDDFEVFEDGTPQRVEQFEFVRVQTATPQATRREPQTVAESRAMSQEPRNRVFVVFLDTYHTGVAGSHRMRTALTTLLDRILGPDDLVGVMTPEMSAADVTLARRTETIEGMLSEHWNWGRRDSIASYDPEERDYMSCFPDTPGTMYAGVAQEMIDRRREKLVLDALDNLAVHLRDMREERKAVLMVSDGWVLFRPNSALTRIDERDTPPGRSPMGVGPTGRITTDVNTERGAGSQQKCEADRLMLSMLDDEQDFRNLLDRANRSNVTFYPIDSRGLVAFDSSLANPLPPALDAQVLRRRLETLQTLAANTDGMAVINSNNIEAGLARIAADLSSYYLLGYYSTNAKLDGRFRSIKVRVKRPGVQVRARRGYLAATEEEVAASPRATTLERTEAPAVDRAIAGLSALRADSRVRTHVAWLFPAATGAGPGRVWVTFELDRALVSGEWRGGGKVDATLAGANNAALSSQSVDIAAGQRTGALEFRDVSLETGDVVVRLRMTPAAGGLPLSEAVRFSVPSAGLPVGTPQLWRRGPATGPQFVLTGDAAFRRNEIVRFEYPVSGQLEAIDAELLDRNGRALAVPVTTRAPGPGSEIGWARAEVALAPLAAADYAVRVSMTIDGKKHETVTAFRVVP